jgi:hypothetical protein
MRAAVVLLSDGRAITVSGFLAIKLLKMLKARFQAGQWPQRKRACYSLT